MSERRPHETVDQATREKILERDGHQCRFCGNASNLEVHHIRREPDGMDVHDQTNLTTLCRDCHLWFHQMPSGDTLPVELTEADQAELVPYDTEILEILAEHGPMDPSAVQAKLSVDVTTNTVRQRLWLLMGLDNVVESRTKQIVDQDAETGQWGLTSHISESRRGEIPEDRQRLVLRNEDEMVRRALASGISRERVAEMFDISIRATWNKQKRAWAYDFPADALKGGRRGEPSPSASADEAVEVTESPDAAVASNAGDHVGGEDLEVWEATGTDESVTAAELLDDVEEVAEGMSGSEDGPKTHLERAIAALQAAKSAL